MKTFFFMAGLPRSGSTLLSALLNQNPLIHASSNSPICSAMSLTKGHVLLSEQYRAHPKPEALTKTLYGMLDNYYSDIAADYVVDKSREWSTPEHFSTLIEVLPYKPKVVIMVRDILDILASFINLSNENSGRKTMLDTQISSDVFHFYRHPNDLRCDYLMHPKGGIDSALYGITNALLPDNQQYFHFIEYEELVASPTKELAKLYSFLEVEPFEHDLSNIDNSVKENDEVYGLIGMHDVRPTVSHRKLDKNKLLSEYVLQKYANLEFWRNK